MINSILLKDFFQWASSLDHTNLTETDKKLLNLFLEHIGRISSCGVGGGKRAKLLGQLIENTHNNLSAKICIDDLNSSQNQEKYLNYQISEISIGPFRGFTSNEVFKLDKKYAFMYGPNGSGKTSFCEGIEYALLDGIEEANSKRIPLEKYAKNSLTDNYAKPILYTKDTASNKIEIKSNPTLFRFAFIERNRIDGFARITAESPKTQRARIVTLFGLDAFSNFVDGFTDNFDYRYINLDNSKEKELDKKSEEISYSKTRISEIELLLETYETDAQKLLSNIEVKDISTLEELIVFLEGEDDKPGKISQIHERKAEEIAEDFNNQAGTKLSELLKTVDKHTSDLLSQFQALIILSSDINYKDLYSALESINNATTENINACPACDTPFQDVTTNPFTKATNELQLLKDLVSLQENIEIKKTNLTKTIREANKAIEHVNTISHQALKDMQAIKIITELSVNQIYASNNWNTLLESELSDISREYTTHLTSFKTQIDDFNLELESKRKLKAKTDNELDKYNKIRSTCNKIIDGKESSLKEQRSLQQGIDKFNEKHENFIKDIKKQNKQIETHQQFVNSYKKLISNLKSYRDNLPSQLATGLSGLSVEFYNIINEHDQDFEKIDLLTLPTQPKQEISLTFKGSHQSHNALNILSEGHIKILGLSILLSKIVNEELGFIIYDDIVNAIDDEHRDGIAELLLNHPKLKERQHIITCHGELFINKLEQKLGASRASKEVNFFRFIPSDLNEQRGIKVSTGDSKHYLLIAKEAYENDNRKKVAGSCRQALEALSEKLWKKLGGKLNINLSVKMRTPNGSPDLASVIDGLIKEVSKIAGTEELHNNLKLLKDKYSWSLLNKGTHEQCNLPEFERSDVYELLNLVISIEEQIIGFQINLNSVK